MENLKSFFIECMLFQNTNEGYYAKHWQLGIYAWLNIIVIIIGVLSFIFK